jgi:hypothetical protein
MGSDLVVLLDPEIQVALQLLDGAIDFFAEGHPVELVEDGLVEPLDDAVGLRALGLGSAVIDVLDGESELVLGRLLRSGSERWNR